MASAAALEALATGLNERQRAYLLAAYDEDQAREGRNRGLGGPPARRWRWIEYGPVGHRWLDAHQDRLLRVMMSKAGLVISQGEPRGECGRQPSGRGPALSSLHTGIGARPGTGTGSAECRERER